MEASNEAPIQGGSKRGRRLQEGAVLAFALAVFLLAAGWRLSLPGLQYDECLAAAPAVNFVRGVENTEPMHIRPSVIRPFGHPLPVMVLPYIGPVKTLAHAPFFALFGISTVTVRLLPLVAGLLSLVLSWWICRRLWGRWVAHLAVLLVALDPSWIYFLTRDVGPAALAVLAKLTAVALGIRWWRDGGLWSLAGTAFVLGLGISHKADFLWLVAALGIPLVVLAPRELAARLRGRNLAVGGGAFLAGSAPVVAFNVATGGHTFGPFLERLLISEPGRFLGGFLGHFATRAEQVSELLNGDAVHRLFFAAPPPASWSWVVPALVAVSGVGLLVLVLGRFVSRSPVAGSALSSSRSTLALLLHVVVFLVASCFSPTRLEPHHLLALYPACHVVLALGLVESRRALSRHGRWRRGRWRTAVTVVGVTVVLAANLTSVFAIDRGLRRTGGVGYWSDAIDRLAEDLRERREPVTVMDWGFTNNLLVLTRGELRLEPAYRAVWRGELAPEPFARYVEPDALYLFHAPGITRYRRIPPLFRRLAARRGLRPRIEARFHQRDGREVYRLLRLVRAGEGSP